ncbi:MAG: hypothetical protein K2X01_00920 [Cyanobacteria bacterium]|nr:hypothetical protein [Cyanobacteriota bacterium]
MAIFMTDQSFKRWYDYDTILSKMVGSLETMTNDSRRLFGYMICCFSKTLILSQTRTEFLFSLNLSKVKGLFKSQAKRRWYDQDPVLHKAFNLLYSLDDENRQIVTEKLFAPASVVREYELACKEEKLKPDPIIVHQIIETCFLQNAEQAREFFRSWLNHKKTMRGGFYLDSSM